MDATGQLEFIRKLLKMDLRKYDVLKSLFDMLRHYEKVGFKFAHAVNKRVRAIAECQKLNKNLDAEQRILFDRLYKDALRFDAEHEFDAFMLYVEYNREPRKRFYQPRRKVLRVVVQDMQDLHDGLLDFLSISLPVRTGKTTLGIFFMVWLILKYPDKPNLMTGHSDKLTKGMHQEILNILRDEQYLCKDVFPDRKIVKISNEDETVDIDTVKRFPTLTCRSVLGTLTGAVDIKGLLYADDLVEDLEEALNPNRMDSKYDAYLNQVKDRKGDGVPELHIGTRWNVNDPIGRIQKAHGNDPRYRFRVISALDENDESNFIYDYPEISFSTKHYINMRKEFEERQDMSTWYAKFQGTPRVREGLVFDETNLNYYEELPPGEYDVYMFCDVAWGGSDALSAPFAYRRVTDGEVYIEDIVYNKRDKEVTEPIVEARIIEHKPILARFEINNGGDMYKDDIENHLVEKGHRFNIDGSLTLGGKKSKGAKHSQILAYAPDIRSFHFKKRHIQNSEYKNAFNELISYTESGYIPHDDVADSLAKLAKTMIEGSGSYEIGDRLW